MIEDDELRALFKIESEEHLQRLEEGLLLLEQEPVQEGVWLQELLREAHSLKGAARMLGLSEIELLSHSLEDALRTLADGEEGECGRLLDVVDAIKSLVGEAINGAPSDVVTSEVIAHLRGADAGSRSTAGVAPVAEVEGSSVEEHTVVEAYQAPREVRVGGEALPAAGSQGETSPPDGAVAESEADSIARIRDARLETIRVNPARLDALLTDVGELTVTSRRILRHGERAVRMEKMFKELEEIVRQLSTESVAEEGKRLLSQSEPQPQRLLTGLQQLGEQIREQKNVLLQDSARLEAVTGRVDQKVHQMRMLPLSMLFDQFKRMVRDIGRSQEKSIRLRIEGGDTLVDKRLVEELKDPLMHLLRNAISHGIETDEQRRAAGKPRQGEIRLRGGIEGELVRVEIEDDGAGLDYERIRARALEMGIYSRDVLESMKPAQLNGLIFNTGLTTAQIITDISGRGLGLDVVHNSIAALKGSIEVESKVGQGVRFQCLLPQSFTTSEVILVSISAQYYAVPIEFVRMTRQITTDMLYMLEGSTTIDMDGAPLSVVMANELLQLKSGVSDSQSDREQLECLVLRVGDEQFGLLVDAVEDTDELVLKPAGAMLKRVPNILGAGILETGEVCMVLRPQDMLRSILHLSQTNSMASGQHSSSGTGRQINRRVILLAEDSVINRVQEKRILEGAGYHVEATVDGKSAWKRLQELDQVDAIVSDVMMPEMNGFQLTEKVRSSELFQHLPVILVTTLTSNEDRKKGLDVGANAYITKANFDQRALLTALRRLVGGGRVDA